mgnify:CR=1 FL=1
MVFLEFVLAGLLVIVFGGLVEISRWFAVVGLVVFCAPLVHFGIRQRLLSTRDYATKEQAKHLKNAHQSSAENLQRVLHDDSSAGGH